MKFYILLLMLSLFFQASAVRGSLVSSMRSFRSYDRKVFSSSPNCAQELQAIFEEADARDAFQRLADHYLEDQSVGKKYVRNISVFQALSRSDVARMRDVFRVKLDIVAHLWMIKNKHDALGEVQRLAFYRYLSTSLFNEDRLPFEITYPRNSGDIPRSFFYFGKTIRALFDDVTRAEAVVFEEKKRELSLRLQKVAPGTGVTQVHEDYLALIQNYNSYKAYEQRVLLTADHIAGYATRLMESAESIDSACETLMK